MTRTGLEPKTSVFGVSDGDVVKMKGVGRIAVEVRGRHISLRLTHAEELQVGIVPPEPPKTLPMTAKQIVEATEPDRLPQAG